MAMVPRGGERTSGRTWGSGKGLALAATGIAFAGITSVEKELGDDVRGPLVTDNPFWCGWMDKYGAHVVLAPGERGVSCDIHDDHPAQTHL